jgi:hypothetical protein
VSREITDRRRPRFVAGTPGAAGLVTANVGPGWRSVLVLYPSTFEPSWLVHDAPLLATY